MIRQCDLISPDYLEAQKIMHADPKGYGNRGEEWAETVIEVAKRYDVGSILDYGSGRGRLAEALREAGYAVREYDPAIEGKDGPPSFADMVVSTDVMEHIEPEKLKAVLSHIRLLARKVVFLVVSCRPAQKLLPNGNNAHLIIRNKRWWRERVSAAGFRLRRSPVARPAKPPKFYWMGVLKP